MISSNSYHYFLVYCLRGATVSYTVLVPKSAKKYDIVVLGAGPAGLTAAVYAARYNLKTIVFDMGFGRSTWFQNYSNYLGFPKGVKAMDFRDLGKQQAENLGAKFHMEEPVEKITPKNDGSHTVKTKQRSVTADAVIIATGIEDVMPNWDENYEYEGKSMYWCILCDGHYVNGKRVLCVGKDADGVDMTLKLRQFTSKLTFVAEDFSKIPMRELAKLHEEKIPIYEGRFKKVTGQPKGHVKSVTLALTNGQEKTIATDAIFHRLGIQPYNDVAGKLGIFLDERGLAKVDPSTMESNITNVYVVGDMRHDSLHQVHAATYSASRAVIAAYQKYYAKKFHVR
ncbi:NAD(P)/FAD-dependent oxidoreductase [Patescibacteria group bacterium]|nr:NAD(P)/FAD-dependent oxidoreductase [Patescibacteria group bacterium]